MTALQLLILSAFAHHPHDPIDVADLSPGYATDLTLLSSRDPCQNWRSDEILVSRDDGGSWWSSYRGMDNRSPISEFVLSPFFDSDGIAIVTTAGDGVYLTTDGAQTWTKTLAGTELGAGAIATDDTGALVFLVHETGGPLRRSTDLGATWTDALFPGNAYSMAAFGPEVALGDGPLIRTSQDAGLTWDVVDLGVDVRSVAVGTGVRVAGTRMGAYVSTTPGQYDPLLPVTGAPAGDITAVAVAPDYANDPWILLAENIDGPYVSEDGGASFSRQPTFVPLSDQTALHHYGFRVTPNFSGDGAVILNAWEGLILSRDRGFTWTEVDTRSPGMICGIGVSPDYDLDQTIIVGTFDAGLVLSEDAGATYRVHNTGLRKSSIFDVDMGRDDVGSLLAMVTQRDMSGWSAPPWDTWSIQGSAELYASRTALHPDFGSNGLAVMGHRTMGIWRSDDWGATWTDVVDEEMNTVTEIEWSLDGTLALATTRVGELYLSTDLGLTWTKSPALTATGGPTDAQAWLAPGPDGFLVGTADGVFMTTDGVTLAQDLSLTGVVHQVAVAPDGTRFVAMRGAGLWRSDPGGAPWVEVGFELAAHAMPHELETSPSFATDGTVYAGVDDWIYRSTDRGDTFTLVGPDVVRYEEDAAPFKTGSGPRLDTVASPGASIDRMALLPAGETVELTFRGTGIRWVGARGGGVADVQLDGVVVDTVDTGGTMAAQQVFFEDLTLTDELHTLRLVHVSGGVVSLDAFDVIRALPVGTPPTTPGDTGDTGGTPPTVDTSDTGGGTTTDGGSTDDVPAKDEQEGGGCGCTAGPSGSVAWPGLLTILALAARRR